MNFHFNFILVLTIWITNIWISNCKLNLMWIFISFPNRIQTLYIFIKFPESSHTFITHVFIHFYYTISIHSLSLNSSRSTSNLHSSVTLSFTTEAKRKKKKNFQQKERIPTKFKEKGRTQKKDGLRTRRIRRITRACVEFISILLDFRSDIDLFEISWRLIWILGWFIIFVGNSTTSINNNQHLLTKRIIEEEED